MMLKMEVEIGGKVVGGKTGEMGETMEMVGKGKRRRKRNISIRKSNGL
jgi:hypothetical protein